MAAFSGVVMVNVRDPRARWSVLASHVVRIVSAGEWGGPAHASDLAVLDPLAALGAVPDDDDHRHRVIVLRGDHDRELAVIAAGPIQIADIEAADVLPLPTELTGVAAFTAIVAHGAVQSAPGLPSTSGTLSLVIDPSALAAIALTPLAPPVITTLPSTSGPSSASQSSVAKRNHA